MWYNVVKKSAMEEFDMKKIVVTIIVFVLLFVIMAASRVEVIDSRDITLDILQSRKGNIVVEKCIGMVGFNNKGILLNGNASNYYIGYRDVSANEGDIVLTYLVYNPFNNIEDDITWRIDFIL